MTDSILPDRQHIRAAEPRDACAAGTVVCIHDPSDADNFQMKQFRHVNMIPT